MLSNCTHWGDEVPLVLQKRAIMSSSSYGLWTAQIQVYRVTLAFYEAARRQKNIRIVRTELQHQILEISYQMELK